MEFGSVHLHHRHEDGDEEASGSDEMLIMNRNNNINIGGTNLNNYHHSTVINSNEMVEACLSQVQIHQPNPTPPPPTATTTSSTTKEGRYRECLRNHAINVMGHALDGCGEFMPGGPQGSVEALKCAACTCHRNFHRKDDTTDHHYHHHQTAAVLYSHSSHHRHHQQSSGGPFSYYRTSAPSGYLHLGPRLLALPSASGGGGGGSQSGGEDEEEEDVSDPVDGGARYNGGSMMMIRNNGAGAGGNNKKRFRTKFTAEQKERMLVMAEKIGWRIQKCDEDLVQQFCHESNVKRHVFKVWMHNNKHTLSKSTPFTTTTTYYQQSSS